MPAHYDDSLFSYPDYWIGRDYEHTSEILALKRLLNNQHYGFAADIGGGYGRLIPLLQTHAGKISLVEPSFKQRQQAKNYLDPRAKISIISGTAQRTGLKNNSQDLVIIIRVMHHLPQPQPVFRELHRILKPGGKLILEYANSHHFKARLISILNGQSLLLTPIEKRSLKNIKKHTISFLNHSPDSIQKLLSKSGFTINTVLSVSNLRSPILKKIIPSSILINLERILQPILGKIYFGPSIFILASKTCK
jgi:ubiquinone/menaquinone biosynthesis C-methylase UbiE